MIKVVEVKSCKQRRLFLGYPYTLYKNHPTFVPELRLSQKKLLDQKKNPFFNHADACLYLAFKDDKLVGRIAAIKNDHHTEVTGKATCFFGFFDCENDQKVATALLNKVKTYAQANDLTKISGPTNFSTNDTCGLLVKGFNICPTILMPYNEPYYQTLVENYGFKKQMDLNSHHVELNDIPQRRLDLLAKAEDRLAKKNIFIRPINIKQLDKELDKIREIYNKAWEANWGFVPMTKEEFEYAADEMKAILDPDLALIAEKNDQPIAFSLTLPDYNQVTKHIPNGKLFPTGLFKFLYYKNKITHSRLITMGVIKEFQKTPIVACLTAKTASHLRQKGYKTNEISWVLETNKDANSAAENMGGTINKIHRIFELAL